MSGSHEDASSGSTYSGGRVTTMSAYNIFFGMTPEDAVEEAPAVVGDLLIPPAKVKDSELAWGWIGDAGPALNPRMWPRSPLTGLPMRHAITLRLPAEYQRRGPDLPGVAYFMGEGQFAGPYEPVGDDDPFVADLLAAQDHPHLVRLKDLLNQQFGLIWLSEAELSAPKAPPPDVRRSGEHTATDEGENAWDAPLPKGLRTTHTQWVYMAPRTGDPNVGVGRCDEDAGWISPWDKKKYTAPGGFFTGAGSWSDHLGGTSWADDEVFTTSPYYLELSTPTRFVDYGNHESHVIDLETGEFGIG